MMHQKSSIFRPALIEDVDIFQNLMIFKKTNFVKKIVNYSEAKKCENRQKIVFWHDFLNLNVPYDLMLKKRPF